MDSNDLGLEGRVVERVGQRDDAVEPVRDTLPAFGLPAEPGAILDVGQNSSRWPLKPLAWMRSWSLSQPAGLMLPRGNGARAGAPGERPPGSWPLAGARAMAGHEPAKSVTQ